jgi:hypothetical protein
VFRYPEPANNSYRAAAFRFGFCGKTAFDTIGNGGSYLSRNDPRLLFGLGTRPKVDRVTVKWPRGGTQTVRDLPVNRYSTITESTTP